jgi:hypothetical protein
VKITVSVTEEDINKGIIGSSCSCPVALAIKKSTNFHPSVDHYTAALLNPEDDGLTLCDLPHSVRCFIFAFDDHKPVRPFTFELEIPDA